MAQPGLGCVAWIPDWPGKCCAACSGYSGQTESHRASALGTMLHIVPAPVSPGPVVLADAVCSAVFELSGQAPWLDCAPCGTSSSCSRICAGSCRHPPMQCTPRAAGAATICSACSIPCLQGWSSMCPVCVCSNPQAVLGVDRAPWVTRYTPLLIFFSRGTFQRSRWRNREGHSLLSHGNLAPLRNRTENQARSAVAHCP